MVAVDVGQRRKTAYGSSSGRANSRNGGGPTTPEATYMGDGVWFEEGSTRKSEEEEEKEKE